MKKILVLFLTFFVATSVFAQKTKNYLKVEKELQNKLEVLHKHAQRDNRPLFFAAAVNWDKELVLHLLQNPEIDVNQYYNNLNALLYIGGDVAALPQNPKVIETANALITSPRININAANKKDNNTFLHLIASVFPNHTDKIEELVENLFLRKDLDIEAIGAGQRTPLLTAAKHNNLPVLKHLLTYDALNTTARDGDDWDVVDLAFLNLIHQTFESYDSSFVTPLMADKRFNPNGPALAVYTKAEHKIIIAAYGRDRDLIKALLSNPAFSDINVKDRHGRTALMLIADCQHISGTYSESDMHAMDMLLNYPGIDVDIQSNSGVTATDIACKNSPIIEKIQAKSKNNF